MEPKHAASDRRANAPAPFPARLHVLLARDAPAAVVIRRGPARMVATFLWDRDTDTFTLGQWLVGRIYERRADLSPDGRHMIYFARDAGWHSETGGSWTAVSRSTPSLSASLIAITVVCRPCSNGKPIPRSVARQSVPMISDCPADATW